MVTITLYAEQKKRLRCTEQTFRLCGRRWGGMFWENSFETSILWRVKQTTSPGWMHETVLRPGVLGRPRGMGWGGRREGRSGWGTHVNPWLIHVSVWQNPLQYCKVISLQLIKINEKKKKKHKLWLCRFRYSAELFLKTKWACHFKEHNWQYLLLMMKLDL